METYTCLISLLHTMGLHEEAAQLEATQTEQEANEEEWKSQQEE